MSYYLVGHSGGGQFVNRLMAMRPLKPVNAVAANPGSEIFPTRDMPYPYGFGGLPTELGDDNAIKAYLAAPLTFYLGTGDTDPNHPELDKSAACAEKQGPYRLARGLNCYQLGKKVAKANGWPFNWRLVEAPAVAHSASKMFHHARAADALLAKHSLK